MQLLVLIAFFAAFAAFLPRLFKAFYWIFTLPLFTVASGSILYVVLAVCGFGASWSACCVAGFLFFALPFVVWGSPE